LGGLIEGLLAVFFDDGITVPDELKVYFAAGFDNVPGFGWKKEFK